MTPYDDNLIRYIMVGSHPDARWNDMYLNYDNLRDYNMSILTIKCKSRVRKMILMPEVSHLRAFCQTLNHY